MNIIFKNQKKLRLFAILIVCIIVFSVPSLSVDIAENDGSAFITKAEFDALKNSFQSQIDTYNTSIDSKIDTAIASYLAGIKIAKTEDKNLLLGAQGKKLTFFNSNVNQDLAYVYAPPRLIGSTLRSEIGSAGNGSYANWVASTNKNSWSGLAILMARFENNKNDFIRFCSKTAIDNLDQSKKIARWAGYYTDCLDEVVIYDRSQAFSYAQTINEWDFESFYRGFHMEVASLIKNKNLYGERMGQMCNIDSAGGNRSWTTFNIWSTLASFNTKSDNIYASLYNFDYDMFSNMDRTYNWGYDGSYQTEFDGYTNMTKWTVGDDCDCYTNIYNTMIAGGGTYDLIGFYMHDRSLAPEGIYEKKYKQYTKDNLGGKFFTLGNGYSSGTTTRTEYIPMLGFERTYLTNWGQIYNADYDNDIVEGATSVITDAAGKKHLRMTNGVPFITLANGEEMEYTFDFVDKTQDYWVWLKTSPFLNENKVLPGTNETTINLINAGTKTNGAYKIASGTGTIKYKNESGHDETLYLKFGAGTLDATTIKSGTLTLGVAEVTSAEN